MAGDLFGIELGIDGRIQTLRTALLQQNLARECLESKESYVMIYFFLYQDIFVCMLYVDLHFFCLVSNMKLILYFVLG